MKSGSQIGRLVVVAAILLPTAASLAAAQENSAKRLSSIVSVAVEEYAKAVDERGKLISDDEYQETSGGVHSPEVFPRTDGTTYVCAISSESPLPVDPGDVAPDPGAIDRLQAMCSRLSPALAQAKILARQACYRPVTQDGLPLLGRVAGLDNAYVATGHSVWGILNAPATGEAMAELIVDGAARTVDLAPFDPTRLAPLDPKRVRTA